MTIQEYLSNPYGKGSAVSGITQRKEELDRSYASLMDKISHKIFNFRGRVIFHVLVPSEKKDNVSYDVIIEVDSSKLKPDDASLSGLNFKAFSNCPSFVFTYANAFKKNGLLCEWLNSKYDKLVSKTPANQTNRYGIIGLERSLYLALKYLQSKGLLRVGVYRLSGKKINSLQEVSQNVRTQSQIMDSVRAKVKTETTSPSENDDRRNSHHQSHRDGQHKVAKVKTTATTGKTSKNAKKVSTVKSTKKSRTV